MSISFMGAIWVVKLTNVQVAALPAIGVGALLVGGLFGLAAARLLGLKGKQAEAMYCCGSFTNIGCIGSLICYVFLVEAGFALVAFNKLFEEVVYYDIGFPIAKYYSGETDDEENLGGRLKKVITDPFVMVALSALSIGAALSLPGIPRPVFFETVNAVFIPTGTIVLLTSIGLGKRCSSIGGFIKECLLDSGIKFLIIPILAGSAAYLLGFGEIDGRLPLKVVLIVTSMPVAFNALVAASIYDLDLANSFWLATTCALVLVLPWLYFLVTRV